MIKKLYIWVLKLPNFRGKARLGKFLRTILKKKPDLTYDGLLMQLDEQEWLQIGHLIHKPQEVETAKRIEAILPTGGVMIDVGAHVGWLSLVGARKVGAGGRVISVEPQPYNSERLLKNAELNDFENIEVFAGAVSNEMGFARLAQQVSTDKARLSLGENGANDTNLYFTVPVVTLDFLIERYGLNEVDLVKIDVEGLELSVLRGGHHCLSMAKNIILEILPPLIASGDMEIIELLEKSGYALHHVDGLIWDKESSPLENNIWASKL